jgi:hypothetical protein
MISGVKYINAKNFIWLAVPSGEGFTCGRLPVKVGKNAKGEHWGWDGNQDAPTLEPSVHTVGHWHGWVKNGYLVEA